MKQSIANFCKLLLCTAIAAFAFLPKNSFSQSVGINYNASPANASALLDISAAGGTNRGVLIPRIALASLTDATTILTPATSLLVYNTTNGSGLVPGYYYNSGT